MSAKPSGMNWRRLLSSRDFHAAWLGLTLLVVALWLDFFWIAALGLLGLSVLVVVLAWLWEIVSPPSARKRRLFRR